MSRCRTGCGCGSSHPLWGFWAEPLRAGQAIDDLGFDYLVGPDHLYSTGGEPFQPFFEGWTTLSGLGGRHYEVRLGLPVGANPRNFGIVAKMATTVDHISVGRLVSSSAPATASLDVSAHGMGSAAYGERPDWLDEALAVVRGLSTGGPSPIRSRHWFDRVRAGFTAGPGAGPVRGRLGRRADGLRIVARHADLWQMWLAMDDLALFEHNGLSCTSIAGACRPRPAAIEHTIGGKLVIRATAPTPAAASTNRSVPRRTDPIQTETVWTGTPRDIAQALVAFRAAEPTASAS